MHLGFNDSEATNEGTHQNTEVEQMEVNYT
jgi:hypothetical protein